MNLKYRIGLALVVAAFTLASCSSSSSKSSVLQQSAIGKPGELMLVMEKEYFESPMALELYDLLEEDAPALPQSEPSLRISRVPTPSFQGSLQLVRNVLLLDVDPQRYSKVSLKYSYDDWAKGQVVARMTSPSPDSVRTYLKTQGEGLMNLFVRHELFLYGEVIGKTYSQKATDLTDSLFAHHINVPEDIRSQRIGKDFLWMSNSSMRSRHDLLVYTYPYHSPKDISLDALVVKRDSVLKANISGEFEGSYPCTEQNYGLLYRRVQLPDEEMARAELRGLWKMEGGAMMGGPFVSHAVVDKKAGKVYVFEGFVYRPNEDKLHLIRMMEAALYSFRPSSTKTFDPAIILKAQYTKGF
jgi:putative lipoprotein